jgi:V/A-type H+-transporting ATPase subunit I
MIVPMKKVALVCLFSGREAALEKLREMGIMHLQFEQRGDTLEQGDARHAMIDIDKVSAFLGEIKHKHNAKPLDLTDGFQIVQETLKLMDEKQAVARALGELKRQLEVIKPWGDFSEASLKQLEAEGIYVYPCGATPGQFRKLKEKSDFVCEVIHQDKKFCLFAAISTTPLDPADIPLETLPKISGIKPLKEEILKWETRLREIDERLLSLAQGLNILEQYKSKISGTIEFLASRDSMSLHGELAYLSGYIPARDKEKLKQAAISSGWALSLLDPGVNDNVPTMIELPKIFRMVQPVFDFLGLSTGYKEPDISICFLVYFSIFFGVIFTDAGYGVIFLIAALAARFAVKNEKMRLPANLFILLSVVTIVWGALCGSWFGMEKGGLEWLNPHHDPQLKNSRMELVCFILAALHLSTGHILKAMKNLKSRKAIGHLGWIFVLFGNLILATRLIIFPGQFPMIMFVLYAVGFLLILTCFIHWADSTEVFSFPLESLGSFVDTLSYIRLFAVSVAAFYIADSFNGMGEALWHADPGWIFIPMAILTVLFGHVMNITLSLLAVLVHGVRLNTLEFSNHAGLKWAGFPFKPFKKLENDYILKGE